VAPVKHPDCPPEVGNRIRRLRLRTGLSQEKFAPLVGITRRHLIRLEKGENRPGRDLALRIEQVVSERTCKPVPFHVYEDAMPPFDQANPDVRVELYEALRRVLREELAALRRELTAA
jgi:transcriptional regulator with XRE-family HTH domain